MIQPRVTPSLPVGREGSLFQRTFSSMSGIDPYAGAVSDVYQDLFDEGSYIGKGIYDVDAFEAALAGRVPDSTLLSHDLFEGVFARAGLASDIEVVEEFPARYDVDALRHHRWARGDWQLLPWILGHGPSASAGRARAAITAIGRWKMTDNLRRTLSAPAAVLALLGGLALSFNDVLVWTAFVLATIMLPTLIPVIGAIVPHRAGTTSESHLRALGGDIRLALTQSGLQVAFLAHQAWLMGDAIGRTLIRLLITRRHLLEWVTAAQASLGPRLDLAGFYRRMANSLFISGLALAIAGLAGHGTWPLASAFAVLWIASPAIARWMDQSVSPRRWPDAGVRRRRRRVAADGAPDLAVLRDVRDLGRSHAAAGQFPGGPAAGARPSNLADQPRPLSPVGRNCPRLRVDGNNRNNRAPGGDARNHAPPRTLPRPFLQLVRHARSAAARSPIHLLGRQRQPRQAPDRTCQCVAGVARSPPHGGEAPRRYRRRARPRA